jgi:hypothetical protein
MVATNSSSVKRGHVRRWWRFRLRTLFVLMTIAAAGIGLAMKRVHDRHMAIELIRNMGGRLALGSPENTSNGELLTFDFAEAAPGKPEWLRRLLGKYGRYINCRVAAVSVDATPPDDTVFDPSRLAPLVELRWLQLGAPADADLLRLPELPNLNALTIGRPGRYFPVSDRGLGSLERLPSLTRLQIIGATLSAVGYAHIARCQNLESIRLESCNLTTDGLAQLTTLRNLIRLELRGSAIGDEAIPQLGLLRNLQNLDVVDTHVTTEGVNRLRAALPECTIKPLFSSNHGKLRAPAAEQILLERL